MSAAEALRLALRDLYANSWRLVAVNAALGAVLVLVAAAALAAPGAAVLVVAAGPVAAALAHCAVTVVRTEDLALADALAGLRLHWRRGLGLAAAGAAVAALGGLAVHVYARAHLWPLAFATLYLLVLLGLYQLVLWTLAVAEPARPLRASARLAAELLLHRPRAALGLGLGLGLVNGAGIAAAVMPFLTLTLAYSFVAAAHFALPREDSWHRSRSST
jgi:hypothetical protein